MEARAFLQYFLVGLFILLLGLAGYLLGLEGFLFFFGIHAHIFLLLMGVALATLFFAVRTTFRIRPANPFLIVLGGSAPLFAVLGLDNIFYVYRPLVLPHPVIVRLTTAFGGLYCVIAAVGYLCHRKTR